MKTSLALLGLGGGEIVLILALLLILWGAKRLPESAKGLEDGIERFRNETEWFRKQVEEIREHKSQWDGWERVAEVLLIAALICVSVMEVLALGDWVLQ